MGKHRASESILPLELGDYERISPKRTDDPSAGSSSTPSCPALERHYSIGEVGQLWGLSVRTVRKMFADEPGVVKWGHEETRFQRSYFTLRIPEPSLNDQFQCFKLLWRFRAKCLLLL